MNDPDERDETENEEENPPRRPGPIDRKWQAQDREDRNIETAPPYGKRG